MYCVMYEGLPVKNVLPDPDDGLRLDLAKPGEHFLCFFDSALAVEFAVFCAEFCGTDPGVFYIKEV